MQSKHRTCEPLPNCISKNKILYKVTPKKLNQYQRQNFYLCKPQLVAYYDYIYGKISCSKRIDYFRKPTADEYPLDLNADFETFFRRKSEMYTTSLEVSLKYEMSNAAKNDSGENIEKTKVITRRGTLAHIMELCYNGKKGFEKEIYVSRFNNNLFMILKEEDESKNELKVANTHHPKLHNILFSDSPYGISKIDEPIDENIVLVCVHRCSMGKYDLIYSGEVQGIIDNEKVTDFDDLDNLTNRRFVFSKQMWQRLKGNNGKLLRIWLQSYLANVRDVYIGYKNSKGFVCEPIEHRFTHDLPKNCFWKPNICTGFLHDFLENVENAMSAVNCPNTVYEFQYHIGSKTFTYEVFTGKNDKSFIPEEYKNFCTKNNGE